MGYPSAQVRADTHGPEWTWPTRAVPAANEAYPSATLVNSSIVMRKSLHSDICLAPNRS
jgi:hypothetical protein